MKIVISPDSYKGSLSARKVADAIAQGIQKAIDSTDVEIKKIPMADGGEGTVESIVSTVGGSIELVNVTGPLGAAVEAYYGLIDNGNTAIIEMAAASGLPLVPSEKRNPLETTTYGVGELILSAVKKGCKKIVLGIGGSATNDGGMGMAQAIGVQFLDKAGDQLGLGGKHLANIDRISLDSANADALAVEIIAACDVTNPLCGPNGASAIYGPQKGADPAMVQQLDQGLAHFSKKIKNHVGKDIKDLPGSGAAGGMGGGLMAFFNATLKPGVDIVNEITGLEKYISEADLVFTGEGKTDYQTTYGKVPVGIARIAKKYNVPVICLSGGLGEGTEDLYREGVTCLFSITDAPMTLEAAMENAPSLIARSAENIIRLFCSNNR